MDCKVKREFSPVWFTDVVINDSFWSPRIRVNRETTIPHQYKECKTTGRIDAFRPDWKPEEGQEGRHIFWDSDVAKWIESAAYSLSTNPDAKLETMVDEVIDLIAAAQLEDGYLNSYYIYECLDKRWTNLRDNHELYCAGHMMEAAVAYYQATGKRKLLDVISRYADYIDTVFGPEEGKKRGYCGHQEIELGLVKLYRITGNDKYLKLSKFFIDEHGKKPLYFEEEAIARGDDPEKRWFKSGETIPYDYCQCHLPVREQTEAVGHSVRAMYMYTAMADLAGECSDKGLLDTCEQIWDNLVNKRMYITAGIGPSVKNEGFTFDYDLPNEKGYAETCAAIGLLMWNHRLLHLDCDGRFADIMERALYNGILSGVSLDGKRFFYENPLASIGDHHRKEWFGCACCPPNIARTLASLGSYIYSVNDTDAVVHLYIQGEGKLNVAGQAVKIAQKTEYPWDGTVTMTVDTEKPATFGLRLRIPAWCKDAKLSVNGESVDITSSTVKGYARVEREWKSGDKVELVLAMPIERLYANPEVRHAVGRVALQRGPVVFCLEQTDNIESLNKISLPKGAELKSKFEKDLLGGVVVIEGQGEVDEESNTLYSTEEPAAKPLQIKAIPYYAWDNRDPGQMMVWIRS